eukprot:1319062-Lingulodinium_polyedra.AAC.1
MVAVTEGWAGETRRQRHNSLRFRLRVKNVPLQWVGQRRTLTDYITNATGVAVTSVDTHGTFVNRAEDSVWAFVE